MANLQYYNCIRLCPHVRAWADKKNNIYLNNTSRYFKCVLSTYDLRPILRGIEAGLIEECTVEDVGTGVYEGSCLPRYCDPHCLGQAHKIQDGVLADYMEETDYLSKYEWKPAEVVVPTKQPRIVVDGDTAVNQRGSVTLLVKLDRLDPVQVPVLDGEGNETGEFTEEAAQVVVNVVADNGASVVPASLTFTSDNFNVDQQVVVQCPNAGAVAVEFAGDGLVGKVHNIKVSEVASSGPRVKFMKGGAEVTEVMIERGEVELQGITVAIEGADCDTMDFSCLKYSIVNTTAVNSGCAGSDKTNQAVGAGDGAIVIDGLAKPSDYHANVLVATVRVEGQCGGDCAPGEVHQVSAELQIKVPEAKMYWGTDFYSDIQNPDAGPTNDEINAFKQKADRWIAIEAKPMYDLTPEHVTICNFYCIAPKDLQYTWTVAAAGGTLPNPKVDVNPDPIIDGIIYKMQYVDLLAAGTNNQSAEFII